MENFWRRRERSMEIRVKRGRRRRRRKKKEEREGRKTSVRKQSKPTFQFEIVTENQEETPK